MNYDSIELNIVKSGWNLFFYCACQTADFNEVILHKKTNYSLKKIGRITSIKFWKKFKKYSTCFIVWFIQNQPIKTLFVG